MPCDSEKGPSWWAVSGWGLQREDKECRFCDVNQAFHQAAGSKWMRVERVEFVKRESAHKAGLCLETTRLNDGPPASDIPYKSPI
jgi:hypothetical protein